MIEKYQSPSAICGMICTANAILLGKALQEREEKIEDVADVMELTLSLRDEKVVMEKVEDVMKFIHNSRMKDIENHDIESKHEYMRAWTANYEISDYLQHHATTPNIFFLRHNQWPERDVATYVVFELARMPIVSLAHGISL